MAELIYKGVLTAKLERQVALAAEQGRRVIAPLMGFPGVRMQGTTVKLAQQNFREHYKAINTLYERYLPDIIFPLMDLSVEANALGFYTLFPVNDTPTVCKSEVALELIEKLQGVDIAADTRAMGYIETIRLLSMGTRGQHAICGYVSGPFTLAALMIGAENAAMEALVDQEHLHALCGFTEGVIAKYARHMVAAGADCICILEPSAVILGPDQFREFAARYSKQVIDECRVTGISTVYHTCGNTMHLIDEMVNTGVSAISLDAKEAGVDIKAVISRVSSSTVVMGNVSPTQVLLRGTPADVRREVIELLDEVSGHSNFVLSTGCDLPAETPDANIEAFFKTAHDYVSL